MQRVLIQYTQGNGSEPIKTILLPKGKTHQAYTIDSGTVCELQRMKTSHSSWALVENEEGGQGQFLSDGSAFIGTPIDVLLVILPFLESSQGRGFVSLSDIFDDSGSTSQLRLLSEPSEPHLSTICDVKEAGGESYYRLNDERVLAWLQIKLKMTEEALEEGGILGGLDSEGKKTYCLGFLGDYLGDKWVARLAERLKINMSDATNVGSTRPPPPPGSNEGGDDAGKKAKTLDAPKVDPKAAAKKKQEETKAAKAAEAAKGTKSITSFFGKKS